MSKTKGFLFLLTVLFCVGWSEGSVEMPVAASKLSVIMNPYNEMEIELKEIDKAVVNMIAPTPTFSLNGNQTITTTESTNTTGNTTTENTLTEKTSTEKTPTEKTSTEKHTPEKTTTTATTSTSKTTTTSKKKAARPVIPKFAAVYYYDRDVVGIFREFLQDFATISNVSVAHRELLVKYVREWDDFISESRDQQGEEPRDQGDPQAIRDLDSRDLDSPFVSLPHEMETSYKLLRMTNRVTLEVPFILSLDKSHVWEELANKVVIAEIRCERFFFEYNVDRVSNGLFELSKVYLTHPWELYPSGVLEKIPLKDVMPMAFMDRNTFSLRELIKWISFARDLILQRSNLTNDSNLKMDNLDVSSNGESAKQQNKDTGFALNYANIARDIYASLHDQYIETNADIPKDILFPELLSKVNEVDQSKRVSVQSRRDELMSTEDPQRNRSMKELCNGFDKRDPKRESTLKCRYDHRNVSWLFLMPVKVEVVHEDPEILIFHKIFSDKRLEALKQTSLPWITEGKSFDHKSFRKSEVTNEFRVSYAIFMTGKFNKHIRDMNTISQYLTGLEVSDKSTVQMNVYLPGGYVKEHSDLIVINDTSKVLEWNEKLEYFNDERMATLLYYFDEGDDLGGRTAYPYLGISVKPEKGSAAFWFNLDDSGTSEDRTKHMGCSVKSGMKWSCNKWIFYMPQLHTRPCKPRK